MLRLFPFWRQQCPRRQIHSLARECLYHPARFFDNTNVSLVIPPPHKKVYNTEWYIRHAQLALQFEHNVIDPRSAELPSETDLLIYHWLEQLETTVNTDQHPSTNRYYVQSTTTKPTTTTRQILHLFSLYADILFLTTSVLYLDFRALVRNHNTNDLDMFSWIKYALHAKFPSIAWPSSATNIDDICRRLWTKHGVTLVLCLDHVDALTLQARHYAYELNNFVYPLVRSVSPGLFVIMTGKQARTQALGCSSHMKTIVLS